MRAPKQNSPKGEFCFGIGKVCVELGGLVFLPEDACHIRNGSAMLISIKGKRDVTDRQITGLWFIITGLLLLSLSFFSYAIVNWAISSGFTIVNTANFTNDQKFILGASGVVSLQYASLTGIPLLMTGLAQVIMGTSKSKKKIK